MRIAMLSPIAWRTPPRHYGPWERVVSLLTEGLLAKGVEVTLFATADSRTAGDLRAVCKTGYEEDRHADPKVLECLHISKLFEQAEEFDLIHNHFDFLPLTYSGLVSTPVVTTIHGFSSPRILPVYEKYNGQAFYVAISEADRSPSLDYIATIHHGIDLAEFNFNAKPDDYLLFFGRIHSDKGAKEAIEIAKGTGRKLIMADQYRMKSITSVRSSITWIATASATLAVLVLKKGMNCCVMPLPCYTRSISMSRSGCRWLNRWLVGPR